MTTAPMNRGTDPVSQRVYALIFNGITRASSTAADDRDWIRLSERERIAEAVYAELREGGIEIRLADGLAILRDVNDRLAGDSGEVPDVVHLIRDGSATTACCYRTPFELPRAGGHRLTQDSDAVTCGIGRTGDSGEEG